MRFALGMIALLVMSAALTWGMLEIGSKAGFIRAALECALLRIEKTFTQFDSKPSFLLGRF